MIERPAEVMGFCIDFPHRLLPYLEDLAKTGLWGTDLDAVVITLVQEGIQKAVLQRFIPHRKNGKVARP
jgi:hypothetical protein